MLFTPEFIREVEEDPIMGLSNACQLVRSKLDEYLHNTEWTDIEHELLWEAASFMALIIDHHNIAIDIALPEPTSDIGLNCGALQQFIKTVESEVAGHATLLKINAYTTRYESMLSSSFAYEFSQGDLERVQSLLNELRIQISALEQLEESHRQRLLKRLEKLQSELHKRVSDLDRFWGLVGDAGVVMGKLGTDAKPIVDRIREIAQISWNTQSRAEDLPSNSPNPMLETTDDSL
ncbi:hypothetical protein [Vibrio sp. AND4]|uniref:hypothetical protein n=1 Tax=Vibrio sp. AND4 TaxID=314289 RepID=UPI00015EFA5A|nr:hypothetical protein [Vibrio sp. AND4]EDP60013.1 hypothetical protein AND4_01353 [Vibrio sp. AND4]